MNLNPVYESLRTSLKKTGKNESSSGRRMVNIQWIIDLPRESLAFQRQTKQILIHTTEKTEKLFIRYPGKESARKKSPRPWDFAPRIEENGQYGPYSNFVDLWVILSNALESLQSNQEQVASVLATIFYRMAFMDDHFIDRQPVSVKSQYLKYRDKDTDDLIKECIEKVKPWYRYLPNKDVINWISEVIPDWGGMSLDAFLHYNNLLAWNEDCKYYYKSQQAERKNWIRNTGRVNTILTHISIIGYLVNQIHFTDILGKLVRGRGVGPATNDEIVKICNGLVMEGQSSLSL